MRQLTGLDASFLYLETANAPMHISGLGIYDQSTAPGVGDGLGLFHAIGSYCGQFMISATSCRVMMPDPAFYRQCLQDSFDELLAAAESIVEKAA